MDKPVVTVARYQDRIASEGKIAMLIDTHGAGSVLIDGVTVSALRALEDGSYEAKLQALADAGDESAAGLLPQAEEEQAPALIGSDTIPAEVEIKGKPVQLGTIVAAAHTRSGLTVNQWNHLKSKKRDVLLNEEIALMESAEGNGQ